MKKLQPLEIGFNHFQYERMVSAEERKIEEANSFFNFIKSLGFNLNDEQLQQLLETGNEKEVLTGAINGDFSLIPELVNEKISRVIAKKNNFYNKPFGSYVVKNGKAEITDAWKESIRPNYSTMLYTTEGKERYLTIQKAAELINSIIGDINEARTYAAWIKVYDLFTLDDNGRVIPAVLDYDNLVNI